MNKTKAQQALDFVKQIVAECPTATDLHNRFFGIGGKFGELFPTQPERESFLDTPEYREISRIRRELQEQEKAVS